MTHADLNLTFTTLLPEFRAYATKLRKFFRLDIDVDALLAEAYIYVEAKKELVENETMLHAWVKTFMKNQLSWSTSGFKSKELAIDPVFVPDDRGAEDSATPEKIEEILSSFVATLTAYEKGLWHIYFTLDLREGLAVAGYLGISRTSAYKTIKECKVVEQKFINYIYAN